LASGRSNCQQAASRAAAYVSRPLAQILKVASKYAALRRVFTVNHFGKSGLRPLQSEIRSEPGCRIILERPGQLGLIQFVFPLVETRTL